MRRIGVMAFVVLLGFALSGCWNRTELNELGITSATGVDRKDGNWIITYQVVVPSAIWSGAGGGGSGPATQSTVHVFTSEGRTIREAVGNAYRSFTRRLYFSHTNVLVVGRQAAEEGVSEILDLYLRSFDSRETVLVAVADGYAFDIVKQLVPPEKLPGDALSKILLNEMKYNGKIPAVRIFDLAKSQYSDAKAIGVPEIVLQRSGDNGSQALKSIEAFKKTAKPAELRLNRVAAFDGDRLTGWLNGNEAYGLSWLKNSVKYSVLSFPCPDSDEGQRQSSFQIQSAKTRITPRLQGDRLTMQIRAKASGVLMETSCEGNFSNPAYIEMLERQIEKDIERYMETGWQASLRLKLDLPGFADRVHKKYPKRWKRWKEDWKEQMQDIKLDIKVQASVKYIGLSENPSERNLRR